MKAIKIITIILCTMAVSALNRCSCDNGNGAFHDEPTIRPVIKFMFPPYSPVDRSYAAYVEPENIAEDDKLAPNGAIMITLNKPVDRATVINGQTIKVQKLRLLDETVTLIDEEYLEGTISHKTNDNIILFIPAVIGTVDDTVVRMESGCVYRLILDGITDSEGESLDYLESLFVTKENIDETPPYILGVEKIVTTDTSVTVYFEEPLDPRYVSEENISLYSGYTSEAPVLLPVTVSHGPAGNRVTLETRGFTLEAGVTYTIVLGGGAEGGVRDLAGNVVESQELSFTRVQTDYVPIAGTFTVNNGAETTCSQSVVLNLSLSGVEEMRFSNDNATWSDWEAFAATKEWTLDETPGTKTVYGQFKDRLGTVELWKDTITLSNDCTTDNTPPAQISLTGTSATTDSITFTWNDPADADLDHLEVTWEQGGSSESTTVNAGVGAVTLDSMDSAPLAADTTYTIRVCSVDTAGNASDPYTFLVTTAASDSTVFTTIATPDELYNVRNDLDGNYIVIADIDLSAYSPWESIGTESAPFTGTFNGNGHTISNVIFDLIEDSHGLFGYTGDGVSISNCALVVTDNTDNDNNVFCSCTNLGGLIGQSSGTTVTLTNCSVSGTLKDSWNMQYSLGGLVGEAVIAEGGTLTVTGCSFSGAITSNDKCYSYYVGGLIGYLGGGGTVTLARCSVSGSVSTEEGMLGTGGLVGGNYGAILTLTNCSFSGDVSGSTFVGGLAGFNNSAGDATTLISGCSVTGTVTGDTYVGGLIGSNGNSLHETATLSHCFFSGTVSGGECTGGLVGLNNVYGALTLSNCYAAGTVNGSYKVGGLIGYNNVDRALTLSHCYAAGTVSEGDDSGGLVGLADVESDASFEISDCFYDSDTAGIDDAGYGTPKTTEEMHTITTFTGAGWDFAGESANGTEDTWSIDSLINNGYPYLSGLVPE